MFQRSVGVLSSAWVLGTEIRDCKALLLLGSCWLRLSKEAWGQTTYNFNNYCTLLQPVTEVRRSEEDCRGQRQQYTTHSSAYSAHILTCKQTSSIAEYCMLHIYIHAYTQACTHASVQRYTIQTPMNTYRHTYICMQFCFYVCMCAWLCGCILIVCMHLCMYACVHACMHACMYDVRTCSFIRSPICFLLVVTWTT